MRTIPAALATHLAGELTTLATCWKITPTGRAPLGFTDHDRALSVEGLVYEAASGFTPSAIAGSDALAVDNLTVEGMLASGAIEEEALLAGVYDHAFIEIFTVNYENTGQGRVVLRSGWLGEVRSEGGRFLAEVRGLTQPLAQRLGALYTPACRAMLGDERCKVPLPAYTVSGVLDGAEGRDVLLDAARAEPAGTYGNGAIAFTGGANAGVRMEVKEYTPGTLRLVLPLPYTPAAGDAYTLEAGCDKTFATCCARFGNAVNFRGEPHVPGTDRMLETAGTRSEWE